MARSSNARKPYTSAEQVKDAVLMAGRQLLEAQGTAASSGIEVKLKDAIIAADVPKTSAYRVFADPEHSPQSMFAAELVRSLVTSGNHTQPEVTFDAALGVLGHYEDALATGTNKELAQTLREVVRVVSAVNTAQLVRSIDYQVYVGVLASIASPDSRVDPAILEAVVAVEAQGTAMVPLYKEMAAIFGLQLRSGWSWLAFDSAAASAAYAAALRDAHNPYLPIERPTGPDGGSQEWTSSGVLIEGLILIAAEPVPGAERAADLSSWTTN